MCLEIVDTSCILALFQEFGLGLNPYRYIKFKITLKSYLNFIIIIVLQIKKKTLQCTGNEESLEDCQIRLNGQLFGHRYECPWDGAFVFIHCGERNLHPELSYWGGIRIANSEFEHYLYEYRIHDVVTHENVRRVESVLQLVNITGAGILHNERSPAVQSIMKSPSVSRVSINQSAYHGINVISPTHTVIIFFFSAFRTSFQVKFYNICFFFFGRSNCYSTK